MKVSYIKNEKGEITSVRETTNDGRTSYSYKPDHSVIGSIFFGGKGECTDITEHHKSGSSDSYEPDNSIVGSLFFGGKGKHK